MRSLVSKLVLCGYKANRDIVSWRDKALWILTLPESSATWKCSIFLSTLERNTLLISLGGHNNKSRGFPGGAVVKNPPVNAGDEENTGSIPGSGRTLEEEMVTHSSILAWEIPWREEPGMLQPMGLQRIRYNWARHHSTKITANIYWPGDCAK